MDREMTYYVEMLEQMNVLDVDDETRNNIFHVLAHLWGTSEASVKYDRVVQELAATFDGVIPEHLLRQRNQDGHTPLHLAAIKQAQTMFRPLIQCGADVNTQTFDGKTAAQLALYNGTDGGHTMLLIDRLPQSEMKTNRKCNPYNFGSTDHNGNTLLHYAVTSSIDPDYVVNIINTVHAKDPHILNALNMCYESPIELAINRLSDEPDRISAVVRFLDLGLNSVKADTLAKIPSGLFEQHVRPIMEKHRGRYSDLISELWILDLLSFVNQPMPSEETYSPTQQQPPTHSVAEFEPQSPSPVTSPVYYGDHDESNRIEGGEFSVEPEYIIMGDDNDTDPFAGLMGFSPPYEE